MDQSTAAGTKPTWFQPATLALGLLLAIVSAVVPLVPEPFRMWNVAAFGAIGVFVTARSGFWPATLLMLGSNLLSCLLNFVVRGGDTQYLPIWFNVLCFLVYPLCGLLVRRTENPLALLGSANMGSVAFFLLTNFAAWVKQDMNYGYSLGGLIECYVAGLPFFRGTLVSDLAFSGGLFAAHAVYSRVLFPKERVATTRVTVSGDRAG